MCPSICPQVQRGVHLLFDRVIKVFSWVRCVTAREKRTVCTPLAPGPILGNIAWMYDNNRVVDLSRNRSGNTSSPPTGRSHYRIHIWPNQPNHPLFGCLFLGLRIWQPKHFFYFFYYSNKCWDVFLAAPSDKPPLSIASQGKWSVICWHDLIVCCSIG